MTHALSTPCRVFECIARDTAALLEATDLQAFAQHVMQGLAAAMDGECSALACELREGRLQVIATLGKAQPAIGAPLDDATTQRPAAAVRQALAQRAPVLDAQGDLALWLAQDEGSALLIGLHLPAPQQGLDLGLLALCNRHLQALLQQQRRLQRLHHSAYEDPQVQLPNRLRFVEQVDAAVRTGAHEHTLALLDVDDFSATNDVMGHSFGDRLLDAIARRLEADLPEGVLLARVGADIYGVFGPSASIHPQVLLQGLQPTLIVDGMEHRLSLSCGYVRGSSLVSKTGAELVTDATMALQRAKREHRGQAVHYRAAMGAETRERARMVSDLRVAVDKDQLFLAYQPQIDLHTGALTGFEALLRWRREDGRVVAPNEFIPVAEHSGLIVALGQWVLQQASGTMRMLMDTLDAPGRMAVNVSVAQLRDPAFIQIVRTAIARAGIEGRHLELEITESVALLPTELLDATLHALRGEGISVAIDDFGTGYSSLSSLERMPLDRIKIDRSFVRELDRPGGARIAELVAQLGHRMGLQIVAEGIEDDRTLQLLRAMGCHEGQGFHIAAPMALEELVSWMQAHQGLPRSTRRARRA